MLSQCKKPVFPSGSFETIDGDDGLPACMGAGVDGESSDWEKENLLESGSSYAQHLCGGGLADAEFAVAPREGEAETLAILPCVLDVTLPQTWRPGQMVRFDGPYGAFTVRPGPGARPGARAQLRVAPRHEFRVEVPPGAAPGAELLLRRETGEEVVVLVPGGVAPGEFFGVMPPAVMVQVPQGARAGDAVRFRLCGEAAPPEAQGFADAARGAWCRAAVPGGLLPGDYFAVRLPGGL